MEDDNIASILKTMSVQILIKLLSKIKGSKDLVISSDLIGILDMICGFGILKENGVEKIFKLEAGIRPGAATNCCYVVNSNLSQTKLIADQINCDKLQDRDSTYWIIFVPRKLEMACKLLEEEGVFGYVNILEYPLGLIPLDSDIFTLEIGNTDLSYFLEGDQTFLHHVASSINQMQDLCGNFSNIYGQGRCAKIVLELLSQRGNRSSSNSAIGNIFIFDREVDYVSVLLSQLSYAGLLDEGKVEFGPEVTKTDKGLKHPVHSIDPVFRDIRDKHFSCVFTNLKEKGQQMRQIYDKRHEMSITDMKEFVNKDLKNFQFQYKSLSLHITACEVIMERKRDCEFSEQLRIEKNLVEGVNIKESLAFIEDHIMRQLSPTTSLRLISLLSLTQDGIHKKDFKNLITLYAQSYGSQHIISFHNLKKLGILHEQTNSLSASIPTSSGPLTNKVNVSKLLRRSQFRNVAKKFNLIPSGNESYDVKNPIDASYVFGGCYIPLITRLVDLLLINKSINDDMLKLLQGEFACKKSETSVSSNVFLVYFIGGVTFAEISSLRYLAKRNGLQILIASTSIVNGNSFAKCLMTV